MTPRNLFDIILKVIGLFFLPTALVEFSQFIVSTTNLFDEISFNASLYNFIFAFLTLSIYLFMIYVLILKSNWVIDKLNLDKNFEQEILPLNIHRTTILSISIIVIGGLIIIDAIPLFCRQVFLFFQYRQELRELRYVKPFDNSYIFVYASKIIIGLVLVGNQQTIINFIEHKRKNKSVS